MKQFLFIFMSFFVFAGCITVSSLYNADSEETKVEKNASSYLKDNFFPADNKNILYTGRIDFSNPKKPKFDWPGVSIKIKFFGTSCAFILKDGGNNYEVIVDGNVQDVLVTESDKEVYTVADNLSSDEHIVELYKRTEASFGTAVFKGVVLSEGGTLLPLKHLKRKIEFIGDSITCGYGNEGLSHKCDSLRPYENNYMAFGPIAARILGAEAHIIAISGKGVVHNYGEQVMVSPQPLPFFYERILQNQTKKWNFKNWQPDIVVIGLSSNDYSAGRIPDDNIFISHYTAFVKKIRKKNPDADIICSVTRSNKMKALENVKKSVAVLKKTDPKIHFLAYTGLDNNEVGCDYHPNVSQHKKMAEQLAAFIKSSIWPE